jgi:hypothetical protein
VSEGSIETDLRLFGGYGNVVSVPTLEADHVKYSSQATTLVSELTTALGTIRRTLPEALAYKPTELAEVPDAAWTTLAELAGEPKYGDLFSMSFENGRSFAESPLALRHRQPQMVEWCGPRKIGGQHAIPADLRVDDVYLISCKYNSKHLSNSGPSKLFENRLRETPRSGSWYEEVALAEYRAYFSAVRDHFGLHSLSRDVVSLTDRDRAVLAEADLPQALPDALADVQAAFCSAVSIESAARWSKSLTAKKQRGDFAMTMLRIPQAVYFLLGQRGKTAQRFKVLSRWDWTTRYEVRQFEILPSTAMQPTVQWRIDVLDRETSTERSAEGHVEIRWSHGRFNGVPEAKVVLDSELHETPGYVSLDQ